MKIALVIVALLAVVACKKSSDKDAPKEPAAGDQAMKPTEPAMKPADPAVPAKEAPKDPPKAEPMVDHDLAPLGKDFAGYVVTAPQNAKIELDDASRSIVLSDVDSVSIGEAEFWEDGVKTLATDKDNSNIKQVSATEVRYERNPPLGKAWNVDTLIKVGKGGKAKYSCGTMMGGTFTSEAMAEQIATICKSVRKK